jgi:hypothetical protein
MLWKRSESARATDDEIWNIGFDGSGAWRHLYLNRQ